MQLLVIRDNILNLDTIYFLLAYEFFKTVYKSLVVSVILPYMLSFSAAPMRHTAPFRNN